jgi:hypothetical protein
MGSFKFKASIDEAIKELKGLNVTVLGPDLGGLCKYDADLVGKYLGIDKEIDFFPLASERNMTPGQVETDFLKKIRKSNFVYLVNPKGYVGNCVSMEIGFCMGKNIPIYSLCPVDMTLDLDIFWKERVKYILTKSVSETVSLELEKLSNDKGILTPTPAEAKILLKVIKARK